MFNRQYYSPLLLAYLASDKLNLVHDASSSCPGALYLGSLQAAQSIQTLKKHSIKHVLTVADGTNLTYKKQPYIQNHLILLADDIPTFDLTKHFNSGIEFIRECRGKGGGNILVHCHAGISRSSTMVLAYLMKVHGWSLEKGLGELRKRRPIVQPNPGFLRQLGNYERKIKEGKDVGSRGAELSASKKQEPIASNKRPASLANDRDHRPTDKFSTIKQRQKLMQQELNDLLVNKSFQPKPPKIQQEKQKPLVGSKVQEKKEKREWGREVGKSEPKISKTSKDPFRPKDVPLLTRSKMNYHFTQKGFNSSDNMRDILSHGYGMGMGMGGGGKKERN